MRLCAHLALLALCLIAGCATTRMHAETSAAQAAGSSATELDFLDRLEQAPVATNDDALHALMLVVADGAPVPTTFEERVRVARERGWLTTRVDPSPYVSARVGDVAVAVCAILETKGGLTMRLVGRTPRYCTRELVYMELLPMRTENQSLSGLELIDLIGRVEDHLARREMSTEAVNAAAIDAAAQDGPQVEKSHE